MTAAETGAKVLILETAPKAYRGDTSNFHPTELDGMATSGLIPPKTNWARPIVERPFDSYSLRTDVTFT